jgi:hypothetical protein
MEYKQSKLTALDHTMCQFMRRVVAHIIVLGMSITSYGQTTTITSSGTWTCPPGITTIQVEVWGGGGAGGKSYGANGGAGGGGGGGSYAKLNSFTVTPGVEYIVTVGGIKTSSTSSNTASDNNGNPSWFDDVSTVFAPGGPGGAGVSTAVDGAGGSWGGVCTGCIGDVVQFGGNGANGNGTASAAGGAGGGAGGSAGNGGNATAGAGGTGNSGISGFPGTGANGPGNNSNGFAGVTYGGGGSGGKRTSGAATDRIGGAGESGVVIITNITPPLITGYTPTAFTSACTQTVIITGLNFSDATGVTFNGTPASSFTVNSSTQITASTPLGITAGVITVTTPYGSANSEAYSIEVFPPLDAVSAGPDQNLDPCLLATSLAGSTVPEFGLGTWSVLSGTANITSPHSATSGVNGLALDASITLRWTVTLGCETQSADVTITTITGAGCNDPDGRLYEVNGTLFNHTTPYTVPADVTSITVECWGAGGGGGYSRTFGRRTAGGGGGAYARSILTVGPGAVFTVGVGLGGEGPGHTLTTDDAEQRPGGPSFLRNSSDVNVVLAAGGISARNNREDQPGAGGQAGACVFNEVAYSGGNGVPSTATASGAGGGGAGASGPGTNAVGGNGGAGGSGLGGNGANGVLSDNSHGNPGARYGGGGSGAWRGSGGGSTNRDGGAGAVGFVRITFISTLPVELISFNAHCENELVTLKWSTASEYNASHFSVQNSRDGINWVEVAEIPAAGTTNQTSLYSCEDNAFIDLSYYRLVQVDNDGSRTTYGPVSVQCEINKSTITVYPNPTETEFTVMIQTKEVFENAVVELIDMFGRLIDANEMHIVPGSTLIKFENKHIKPGTYLVRIKGQNDKFTPVRVVVM